MVGRGSVRALEVLMTRMLCGKCESKFLSTDLFPCPTCFLPHCASCLEEHVKEKHKIEKPIPSLKEKKAKKEDDDERSSLADA